jgi:glycosyltransferase involved in cell wall biosynthesis
MVIAVDISVSEKKALAWQEGPVYKNLIAMASLYPQHKFVFISDRANSGNHLLNGNCISVVAGPGVNSQLMQYFWYNYKLPSLLRKHKADIFLGVNSCCSMNTPVPQYLLLSDDMCDAGQQLQGKKNTRFVKKQLPLFLEKAARIIATTNLCRNGVLNILPGAAQKTVVAYLAAANGFEPLTPEDNELVKAQYTGGKEYFLHGASISSKSQFVNLLKAFSIFKKRQKSNMQLLLSGHIQLPNNDLKAMVSTYKYRDDVKITGYLSTPVFARVLAGAYALVHTGKGKQLPAEAMSCGVPLITADTAAMQEICGEAALYMNPGSPEAIAEQMMLVFKDENLRNRQISKGDTQVERYSSPFAVIKLAEAIFGNSTPEAAVSFNVSKQVLPDAVTKSQIIPVRTGNT